MGRVEKFTVLAVLLLIAIILVVSMTTDNPVDKTKAAVLGEKPSISSPSSNEVSAAAPGAGDSKLLSATVGTLPEPTPAPAAAAPQPLAIPANSLIKSTEGLSLGFDSSRMLYTWQSGDSYVTVAKRVYGDATKFSVIKNANEGREDVQPGEKILVPIHDVEAAVAEAPAATPEAKPEAKKAGAAKSAPVSTGGRLHTVKKGESLWKIAKAELGEGARWKEIYDLNTDKLKTPESLRDGMKLTLP